MADILDVALEFVTGDELMVQRGCRPWLVPSLLLAPILLVLEKPPGEGD
jgi:hypothetical protein